MNPASKPNHKVTSPSHGAPCSAEARLRAERDRFVALAFCWADTLIELDQNNIIVFAAGMTMAVSGHNPSGLMGKSIDDILAPESRPPIDHMLKVAKACGRVDYTSITFKGPDGEGVPVDLAAHNLPDLGDQSFLAIRLGGGAAQNCRPQSVDEYGLLDPQALIGVAKRLLTRRHGSAGPALTLLSMPEIGELRQILDDSASGALAATIAGYLKARSINRASAAWLGGGRYGLVHSADLDVERLESQLLSMAKDFAQSDVGASVESASIMSSAALSDDALGQIVVYAIRQFRDADNTGFSLQRLRDDLPRVGADAAELAQTLTSMVETGSFHIAFQPIVSGDSGEILSYEGLARIDGRDDASPYKYIAYAEETGQICRFDIAMAEKALLWLESRSDPNARVSINLSGLSMLDPEFITGLHKVLDGHPDVGRRLAFEITDSSHIPDLEAADRLVQSLRQKGHLVGLDDFATGIGGFRILAAIDVDFVKFNREAVKAARATVKSKALLISLTGLCRTLNIQTIATAVEEAGCLAVLRDCGITCIQGYLFGRPNPDSGAFQIPPELFRRNRDA